MDYDVELMRDLMLELEDLETSPRATVIVSIDEMANTLARFPERIEEGLNVLLELAYIDGPGKDEPGFWFFRKLTRKGIQFLQATRNPADWDKMKRYFASRRAATS